MALIHTTEDALTFRGAISDAYYDARNEGRTMEQAADDATARVVDLVEQARADAWDEAMRWVRRYAENTSPEHAIEHIDRAEPFNPYRIARGGEGQ